MQMSPCLHVSRHHILGIVTKEREEFVIGGILMFELWRFFWDMLRSLMLNNVCFWWNAMVIDS